MTRAALPWGDAERAFAGRAAVTAGAALLLDLGLVLALPAGAPEAVELARVAGMAVTVALAAAATLEGVFAPVLVGRAVPRALRFAVALALGVIAGGVAYRLTGGRWASVQPWRPLATLAAAASAAACGALAFPGVGWARSGPRRWGAGAALWVGAAALAVLNATVGLRLYVLLHDAVSAAVVAMLWFASVLVVRGERAPASARTPARVTAARAAVLALGLAGAAFLAHGAPHGARVVVAERTAAARLAALTQRAAREQGAAVAPARAGSGRPHSPAPPISSRQFRSVLLVTVDALRADAVRPADAPALTRLFEGGVRFTSAYTTEPNTSYALLGLHAGTHARTAFDVGAEGELALLAGLLRGNGYATRAFYQEAVGHVDAARLAPFLSVRFGFEAAEVDDRPAAERARAAEAWMRSLPPDRPFLLWVHFLEPHEPYEADPRGASGATDLERYRAEVRRVDAAVGPLAAAFASLRPDGVGIVTADHGEEFGEHGGRYHGTSVYDEQVRVPLAWFAPWLPRAVRDEPVSTADVAPTLLRMLGFVRPARMTGRTHALAVEDAGADAARDAESPATEAGVFVSAGEAMAWVERRYKWMGDASAARGVVFDRAADPGERHDLSSGLPDEERGLASRLAAERSRVASTLLARDAWRATVARAALGDAREVPALLAGLRAAEVHRRAEAARALGAFPSEAVRAALTELAAAEQDDAVLAETWLALARFEDRGAVEKVAHMTQDRPREFCLRAGRVLAARRHAAAVVALASVLGDADAPLDARRLAILGLGETGSAKAVPPLCDALPDANLRVQAARALGALRHRAARRCLQAALAVETYDAGREALEEALAAIASPRRPRSHGAGR